MRTALVTGASSGIGAATALLLAERGWSLLLCARRVDRLGEVAAEARSRCVDGATVDAFNLDVRDRASVERWSAERATLLDGVELVVNCAGLARGFATIQEGNQDDWDEMLDTNVRGLLNISRVMLPRLVARGGGDVVNIGSVAGRWTYPKGAVYCGSKAAERAISEGMRMDLLGSGVRVATVDPGMVETEFSLVRFHGDAPRAEAVYRGLRPLTGRDVAETIAWIVERPRHVNVSDVVIYPTDQASPTQVHRRGVP